MKKQDYTFTVLNGIVGAILFILGVIFLFLGEMVALILGLVFIGVGGLLAYFGINAISKIKTQIVEQKIIDEQAKIAKETSIKNNLCPKCGGATVPEDAFCRKCGFKLK